MSISVAKLLLRPLNPVRLVRAFRAGRRQERPDRAELDPQLKLYARILGHGHLHYGYFEDTELRGEEISLADFLEAQEAYARLVLDQLRDHGGTVMDCGCGTGALLEMLAERGYRPVGLTPDRAQIEHIRRADGDVELHHARFEDLDLERHAEAYESLVCSESLQYLDLDRAFEVADAVLAPAGRWIVCDYFRKHEEAHGSSGHLLDAFHAAVEDHGWSIATERDITEHVLGTLRYAHTMADRVGRSLVDFACEKFRQKRPALHDLCREEVEALREKLDREMKMIDPDRFRRDRTYRLFVLERDR